MDENPKTGCQIGCVKGSLIILAAVASIIVGIPAFFTFAMMWDTHKEIREHQLKFDAKVWRSNDNTKRYKEWEMRSCMVDDLIASKKLDGLTRDQVVQLLGPPSGLRYTASDKPCDMHYRVGICRGGFHVDDEWLFLIFGSDGKINRYWLYVD